MAEDEGRRLSGVWSDLRDGGRVPERGAGETARRAERDEKRKRKRMPAEDRRVGRKIAPTLSGALVQRLKAICKEEGYVDPDGNGVIASPMIEDLLWAAVESYDGGEFDREEEAVVVRKRLRRKMQE